MDVKRRIEEAEKRAWRAVGNDLTILYDGETFQEKRGRDPLPGERILHISFVGGPETEPAPE